MGADLYINSIQGEAEARYKTMFEEAVRLRNTAATKEESDRHQVEVSKYYDLMFPEDGYFRDSYNATCLLWQLDMSWWKNPYINKSGKITPRQAAKFSKALRYADLPDPAMLKLDGETIDDGENSREGWYRYFSEKKEALIKFLTVAIDLGEDIIASV